MFIRKQHSEWKGTILHAVIYRELHLSPGYSKYTEKCIVFKQLYDSTLMMTLRQAGKTPLQWMSQFAPNLWQLYSCRVLCRAHNSDQKNDDSTWTNGILWRNNHYIPYLCIAGSKSRMSNIELPSVTAVSRMPPWERYEGTYFAASLWVLIFLIVLTFYMIFLIF